MGRPVFICNLFFHAAMMLDSLILFVIIPSINNALLSTLDKKKFPNFFALFFSWNNFIMHIEAKYFIFT